MSIRNRLQRVENGKTPVIEILRHLLTAHAFAKIIFRAIFSGQEARSQAVIGDDAKFFLHAQIAQRAIIRASVIEVVFRLEHLVTGQPIGARHIERVFEFASGGTRQPDRLHGAGLDEIIICRQGLFERDSGIGAVRKVKVDAVDTKTAA
ncbi:hypothetical protein D9M73_183100 [compost metagenome]